MYPRRIESFESIERVDETGLTGPQKIALQNGWRIIKTQATYHATNIFLAFFGKYPKYFSVFAARAKSQSRENEALHAHPSWVVAKFGTLIEEGLWDTGKFNASIQMIVKRHKRRLLKKSDIECMVSTVNQYFKKVLERYMTPTLSTALDNLCNKLLDNYV